MTAVQEKLALEFEGEPVAQIIVQIKKAGDGLSEGLQIKPVDLALGDEVYYVLKATTAQINHRRDKKTEQLVRVYVVDTEQVAECDEDTALKVLHAQADRIARAKAEIEGQLEIDADEDLEGAEAIASMHEEGGLAPEFKEPTA